jgi:hypothetical protein
MFWDPDVLEKTVRRQTYSDEMTVNPYEKLWLEISTYLSMGNKLDTCHSAVLLQSSCCTHAVLLLSSYSPPTVLLLS